MKKEDIFSKIFIMTDTESGWDCIQGVYIADSEDDIINWYKDNNEPLNEDTTIIHETYDVTELSFDFKQLLKQVFEAGESWGIKLTQRSKTEYKDFENYYKRKLM